MLRDLEAVRKIDWANIRDEIEMKVNFFDEFWPENA